MNKAKKSELLEDLKTKFSKAQVAIFTDYKGLTATQADDLRKKIRESDADAKVVKNNIARLVVSDGAMGEEAKSLMDGLVGPTLITFAYKDPAATAKVINTFAKDNEALILKESLMGNKRIKAKKVEELADLPSKEVLLSMLLSALNGPARGLVGVLSAVPRNFVQVLAAVERKKREEGGES